MGERKMIKLIKTEKKTKEIYNDGNISTHPDGVCNTYMLTSVSGLGITVEIHTPARGCKSVCVSANVVGQQVSTTYLNINNELMLLIGNAIINGKSRVVRAIISREDSNELSALARTDTTRQDKIEAEYQARYTKIMEMMTKE